MKDSKSRERAPSESQANKPASEIRDNLDSRKGKEVNYKDTNNKQGRKPNTRDKNKDGN